MPEIEVDDVRDLWIVVKNTDDTEGRGIRYISHVCETEVTAQRIGSGKYVMGSDCPIEKVTSFKINGRWVQPSPVVPASDEDKRRQAKIDAERSIKGMAEKAIKEAKRLGLSDELIAALQAAI